MRRRKRSERGEGQMGCIFGLVLMAIGIFIAWKLVPIKVRAAELRQEVLDQSKAAACAAMIGSWLPSCERPRTTICR